MKNNIKKKYLIESTTSNEGKFFPLGKTVTNQIKAEINSQLPVIDCAGLDPEEIEYERKELAEKAEKALEREQVFMTRVWSKFNKFRSHPENVDKEIVVLFDVDENIGTIKRTRKGSQFVVRPAFEIVADAIKKNGATLGILSSRGHDKLVSQLDNSEEKNSIHQLNSVFSSSHIYSCREEVSALQEAIWLAKMQNMDFKYANTNLLTKEPELYTTGAVQKLWKLNQIENKPENTDKSFVLVDDFFDLEDWKDCSNIVYTYDCMPVSL